VPQLLDWFLPSGNKSKLNCVRGYNTAGALRQNRNLN
jgi:hypothetical protein